MYYCGLYCPEDTMHSTICPINKPQASCNFWCVLILIILAFPLSAQAPRGLEVVARAVAGDDYIPIGQQYIVLIAIDKYKEWTPLRNPVKDAVEIKKILMDRYYVDEIVELYDDAASSKGIRALFEHLKKTLTPRDSVLIYYAGHGYLDTFKVGFWIPSDGGKDLDKQSGWFSTAQIKNFISELKARSVTLVSDSCFSGDILETSRGVTPTVDSAYFAKALQYKSRQVLTSGASETVPDESEFARGFKSILESNMDTCLDPLTMYDHIRRGMSKTQPLFGTLPGHQNEGSFVLFLRSSAPGQTERFASLIIDNVSATSAANLTAQDTGRRLLIAEGTKINAVPMGSYELSVTHPLWKKEYTKTIRVTSEGELHETIATGSIELRSLPSGASVMIDGKVAELEGGTTPKLLPANYKVSVSAPYWRTFSQDITVDAGKLTTVFFQSNQIGILDLRSKSTDLDIELSTKDGAVFEASKPLHYELDAGEYIVKVKTMDDIDWSWRYTVNIRTANTFALTIPPEALAPSLAWQIREERKNGDDLKLALDKKVESRKTIRPFALGSLVTGGLSALAAGTVFFLGNSAMDSYHGAETVREVDSWRSKVELYNSLFFVAATLSGVGLSTGGVLLVTMPDTRSMEAQLQESINRLRELDAKKTLDGNRP